MKVKRIVANIRTGAVDQAEAFYRGVFGLDVLMNHGWIATYGSDEQMHVQISFASEGGSGTSVPDLSVEGDDIETALLRVRKMNIPLEYGPVDEPWGVRRFYVRDPFGKLVNVLAHVHKEQ